MGAAEKSMGEPPKKFMGAMFNEAKAVSMYWQLDAIQMRSGLFLMSQDAALYVWYMYSAYCVRLCEPVPSDDFVCDLHRIFFDKAQWECRNWKHEICVLQVHYENGLCTPPLVGYDIVQTILQ